MKKFEPKTLLKIPLQVDFETGRSNKTLEDVLEFRKGTILKLEGSSKDVIQVYANGVLYAFGKAVRKDGEMYVKITELNQNKEG